MTYYRVCNSSNMTDTISGTETAYPSGAPEFTTGVLVGLVLPYPSGALEFTTGF
jgi:hypothetical protein